jgi:prepilin-type N-terminal cleavage/methylation domain-containing protein
MNPRRAAFTLLEVMLAVTMLGLLVMALSSTWSAGLGAWKRSHRLAENYQRQRILLDALTEMARAAVYVTGRERLYAFRVERDPLLGDSISFVTNSDALLPPRETILAGLRRVTIGLQRCGGGEPCLLLQNAFALQEMDRLAPPRGEILARDVSAFNIRCRDAQTGIWRDRWAETDGLPSAIEFTLIFAPIDSVGLPPIITRQVDLPSAKLARQPLMPQ